MADTPDPPSRIDRVTFTGILALILTLAFFAFLASLLFIEIPEPNKDLLFTGAGILFGGANMAWGFYLGSSNNAQEAVQ